MKFNSSVLFYFVIVIVFMAMFICAQAKESEDCRIKVYRPRQGSAYQFYSWQYVEYSVSSGCIKTGGRNKIDISIISTDGEEVYDIVKNGYLDITRKIKYWIDPNWANDGDEYYVKITLNKNKHGKSGYFTTYAYVNDK
ncbi:hypothetical protein C1645_730862 [Glomus cerebriforme]|uniref:Uncharacterized protein n=1 Tax=Glomus cerebriforme TaxID=658196 RepID=A0A397TR60_9GLOM|nr:hypothetical protein C1645_730862 [Glomus cerebriforme]